MYRLLRAELISAVSHRVLVRRRSLGALRRMPPVERLGLVTNGRGLLKTTKDRAQAGDADFPHDRVAAFGASHGTDMI